MGKNKPILGAIATMIVFYLLIAFVLWDINAYNWDTGARIMYAIFSPMFAALVYFRIKIDEK
jgi:hypothetical protein